MICYDSFAKLLIQVSQIDKKTCVNDFITQYKRNLSLNKHGIFFLTEKNSQECTKLPCIIENGYFQEEFEKIEYLSKYEKHLYYIFSILPKAKFYPFLYEIPVELRESSIMFDSRFESGNLRRVYQVYFLKCFIVLNRNLSFKIVFITKINENEYELILDFDSNTSNYSQWYFFKVFNIHKGHKVTFHIINLVKQNSFYNNGQQPRIFTDKSFEKNNKSWHYDCSEVSYSRSDLSIKSSKPKKPKFYTLSFTYEFKQDFDQVYFSHCFPYTYLDLVSYIRSSEKLESVKKFLKIERIGRTTIGNEIFCFIITNDIIHKFPFYINSAIKNKKMIFLTGRVHPGESNSSWIIKGMLDFLMGDHIWVDYLRNNYVFVVIPMLNPDGVRYGNYRCNLYGFDLNRQWRNPDKLLQSPIFLAKNYLTNLQKHFETELICDVHGHSKAQEVFLYGCSYNEETSIFSKEKNLNIKRFPLILSKVSEYFSFEKCSFK